MKSNKALLFGVHFLILFEILIFAAFGLIILGYEQMVYPIIKISFVSLAVFLILILINFSIGKQIKDRWLTINPITQFKISVGMTAYNDEESIGICVDDFRRHPDVSKIIVVDNNSTDRTSAVAAQHGAVVIRETLQGYGACCRRALREAYNTGDEIICLVEGDGTFSSDDLKKMLGYIDNADMVIGTRTTRELNTPDSQMNFFMVWGNIFIAKLLQIRFWKVRLTDIGCTYRIIRRQSLAKIIDKLTVTGNHFLCQMNIVAMKENLKVIEVPLTFRKRIGKSKGVGGNILKGLITGLKMWWMILFE